MSCITSETASESPSNRREVSHNNKYSETIVASWSRESEQCHGLLSGVAIVCKKCMNSDESGHVERVPVVSNTFSFLQ